jgi:hypothetical protein
MRLFVVTWICLGVATLTLALWRKLLSRNEDDLIHVEEWKEPLIPEQVNMAHKLDVIDRWGIMLTVLTTIVGLLLATAYLYQGWVGSPG